MTVRALFHAARRFSATRAGAPFGVPLALTASFALGACSGDGSSPSKPAAPEKPAVSSQSGVRFRDVAIAKISHELSTIFNDGDFAFDTSMREADGLGPLYTRNSCNACHDTASRGPGLV